MCGYQGWFNCPNDGMGLGWTHWARNRRQPPGAGNLAIDLWPDVSELTPAERHPTPLRHADGTQAELFSSANRTTVLRHFRWMRDYGIDGVFLQRFGNGLKRTELKRHKDAVLSHVMAGAKQYGRTFAVMYDLSGMPNQSLDIVRRDWTALHQQLKITASDRYQHHDGRPLVAVWGVGFHDRHQPGQYSLEECEQLLRDLKATGCAVMLGVPTGWRTGTRDSIEDDRLPGILKQADVLSPWTPGRYRNGAEAERHGRKTWAPDVAWCRQNDLQFLPVVFPGFSWHNLKRGQANLDQIPRDQGRFLWSQIAAAKQAGADMLYVAMFDEVDEATAIFKCTSQPPVSDGVQLLDHEGLPSDHYLKLVGVAGQYLRGEITLSDGRQQTLPAPSLTPEATP
ncbi:MAG: glycoside hydrolase family 71/99-like protein [Planctomycetaceae bacterium]|nr:glycoside hydrolase family 71/99-like protein [Planctomycetaceae bacterium]